MEQNRDIVYDKFIQIKMLILFVMSRLPAPVPLGQLTELTMCDERIGYFDITECTAKLLQTKHLNLSDGKYSLSAKGLRNSEILENDIPHSVRVKAQDAAEKLAETLKRDSLITAQYTAGGSGTGTGRMKLSLSDGIDEILHIELYTTSQNQASQLETGFRRNANTLYNDIITLITRK